MLPLAIAASTTQLAAAPLEKFQNRRAVVAQAEELRQDLGVTDEQKAQIKAILLSYKPDIKQQIAAGKAAREQMKAAVSEFGPESQQAKDAAIFIGKVAESRALLTGEILFDIKPVLTEEQIAKLEELRETIKDRIEGHLSAHGL